MRQTLTVLELQPPEPFYALGDHIATDLPGARVVFTTRRGGVSEPPYDSLNLGLRVAGDRTAAASNRAILARDLDVELAHVRQVHGNRVHAVEGATDSAAPPVEADGVATTTRRLAAMVLTADCLPVAIAGRGAVAAVHAGWKGLEAGVIAAGVQQVRKLGTEGGPIAAAIGPGASACCYEVSDELHERFAQLGLDHRRGLNLDLKEIARAQLADEGVEQIQVLPWCTICGPPDLFFSHRRDRGVTGRQAGLVWLT